VFDRSLKTLALLFAFHSAVVAGNADFDVYWKHIERQAETLPSQRTAVLDRAAEHCAARYRDGSLTLNFICTHNSRRSQFAQTFAQLAANRQQMRGIVCVSGGTEVTACNPRVVASLRRCGMEVKKMTPDSSPNDTDSNPKYVVTIPNRRREIILFSKQYSDAIADGGSKEFVALMCCSDADRSCPVIEEASGRFPLHYRDPKVSDGTGNELQTYDERRDQIAAEMVYLLREIQTRTSR
jgi:protein-tyrosine-phosphatase